MPDQEKRENDSVILSMLKSIDEKQDTMLAKVTEVSTYRTSDKQELDRLRGEFKDHKEDDAKRLNTLEARSLGLAKDRDLHISQIKKLEDRVDTTEKKIGSGSAIIQFLKYIGLLTGGALMAKYLNKPI